MALLPIDVSQVRCLNKLVIFSADFFRVAYVHSSFQLHLYTVFHIQFCPESLHLYQQVIFVWRN